MTAVPTSKTTQNVIVALFVLAGFVTIFYMYHEPTRTWFKCLAAHEQNISVEFCLDVLKRENYTQIALNNNCTSDSEGKQYHPYYNAKTTTPPPPPPPPTTTTTAKPLTTAKSNPETIILIWMWPFGAPFTIEPCTKYNIDGCRLTADQNLYEQADGVMIHHRDIRGDFSNLPQKPRPALQKWVWWNMESPTHSPNYPYLKELFNLTSSYRRDSDVPVPYGLLVQATGEEKKYTIPKKNKLACWIVSNWNPNYKRTQYYTELSKYITIDAYGAHFNRRISHDEYSETVASCKFYLSFENSIHRDYVTEKLFNPLRLGTVPVVLGPPRENYEQFVPSGAFIHVDDFPSPKELAEHLKRIDQNEELYMRYFTWKENYIVKENSFGLAHSCQACAHIQRVKDYRVMKDLNGWYFV